MYFFLPINPIFNSIYKGTVQVDCKEYVYDIRKVYKENIICGTFMHIGSVYLCICIFLILF